MDRFDKAIIQLLSKHKNMTFNQIQSKIGFSHNTLQQHLEELLEKGLAERGENDPRISLVDQPTSTAPQITSKEGH